MAAWQVYWEVQKGRVARGAPAKVSRESAVSRCANAGAFGHGRTASPFLLEVQLPFALETYRVHFPGTYVLDCFGNLTCAGNAIGPDRESRGQHEQS